jgi:uncharacterized protein
VHGREDLREEVPDVGGVRHRGLGVAVALDDHAFRLVVVEEEVVLEGARLVGGHERIGLLSQAEIRLTLAFYEAEACDTEQFTDGPDLRGHDAAASCGKHPRWLAWAPQRALRARHPVILDLMARDPNIPDAFDVYTLVLLRRPPNAPEMTEEALDELQAHHLAYRADLRRQGVLVANGPLAEQSDPSLRGLSIYACGLEEAARLSEGDPSVQAGRLAYEVFEWWVAAGTLAFPQAGAPVGDRRSMPDD